MKIAWLFPGQGSQRVGMGKEAFEASIAARSVFEHADRALGYSISKLCFEGPQDTLTLTENAQPALVTTSIALVQAIRESHPSLPAPDFAAGHSLGEYSALVAAGSLSLEDAVRVVNARGRAMQEAVPSGQGTMAAVMGGTPEEVMALVEAAAQGQVLSCANFNAPGQIVLAGHTEAVQRACRIAADRKLKAIMLNVSAPFHCSLMRPAADVVQAELRDRSLDPLLFPVVSNVEATPNAEVGRVKELLVRQIDAPVQWQLSIQKLSELGVDHVLEIGPGRVLTGLVKRIDKNLRFMNVADPSSIAEIPGFLGL